MKKKLLIFSILFLIIMNITNVNASTNTFQRTVENNYLVDREKIITYNQDAINSTLAINAEEKIYDFADLYTEEEENKLYKNVKNYIDKYNLDLAIVTISKNNKANAKEYAQDFYDYNDFSSDGVIFLIDMDTREIYMVTTGKAISMYTDSRIDKTTEATYKYMTNKEYYKGTNKFINIIYNFAKLGIPDGAESSLIINKDGEIVKNIPWLIILIVSTVGTIIIMSIMISKNKLVNKATTAAIFLNKDSVNINTTKDVLINTHTNRVKIDHSSSGGGGGSSISHGSSGISHGGGGHKF